MAGALAEDDDLVAAINVTPFVDVVLVLLVILMVTSTDLVRAQLGITLPSAATAGEAVPTTLNIVVKDDGSLWLDGNATNRISLAEILRDRPKEKAQAVISADRGVDYGEVIAVIDLIKASGLNDFALSVEKSAGAM